MPEESSTGAPGLTAPGGTRPGTSPGSTVQSIASRRRRPLLPGTAAVLAAALVTVVAMVVTLGGKPAAAKLKYTSLPAPCTLLTSGTVARFLPGATSSPASPPARASKVGACTWSSITGGEDRTLILQVDVYDSPAGTSAAQQAYAKEVPAGDCRCRGYTVTGQAVTGLGDQATVLFTTTGTQAGAGSWAVPAVTLLVRSGNADINVGFTVARIGRAPAPPVGASLRAITAAMAKDVLAALSRRA
jgi:hypothetical protein